MAGSLLAAAAGVLAMVLTEAAATAAAVPDVPRLVSPATATVSLAGPWKHRIGDDATWARSDYDDRTWESKAVPSGWGRREGPQEPFAWYRLTVHIAPGQAPPPGGDSRLGLLMGKADSAYEVFAGGAPLGGNGRLPPDPRVEYDRHRIYPVPASAIEGSGRLVIAVRVWNSPETNAHEAALVEGPFFLGPIDALTRREMLSELPELILAALFALIGLYHLQLFRRRPELREYLWFGLVAVGTAAYTFLRTQWKYAVFDDFLVLKETEHAILYALAPLYIAYLFPFLSWPIPPLLRVYQGLNVAAVLASVLSPGLFLNLRILTLWEYGNIVFTPYILSVVIRAAWRGHPEGRTIAVGVFALSACYLNDTFVDLGWVVSRRVIPFGFAAFVFSMAVSLANRFTRVYGEVELLRRELEQRVAARTVELTQRTAELQEANVQLQARSRELAEASQAKSQFLANVSHEIRTPMNGVVGMARLLQDTPLTAQQREFTEVIVTSARALLRIIEDILDISKIEAGQFELDLVDFDLRAVTGEVARMFGPEADAKGLALRIEEDDDLPRRVSGDPGRLRQTLVNLVGNAIKFTDQGEVAVRVSREAPEEAHEVLRFSVTDTGIGIPPQSRDRLFWPFAQADGSTTRRFGGTGLGLAISRRLVEMMGGRIEVSSDAGRGSTFSFTVRLRRASAEAVVDEGPAAAARPEAAPVPVRGEGSAARGRILVAEDNPINQKVTVYILESLGFETDVVSSGAEAVAAAARHPYAAILMDGQMPSMDGYEATGRIRALQTTMRTPIIALTASAMRGDRERCLAAGMDDYIAKPVSPEVVAAVLDRWVRARQDAGGAPADPAGTPSVRERSRAAPILDDEILDDLLAATPPRFLGELLALFFRDAAAALTDLRIAWRDDDLAGWRRIAHKLKGSCGTLGARPMMDLCLRMEQLDERRLPEEGEALLDELEASFAVVKEALLERERREMES